MLLLHCRNYTFKGQDKKFLSGGGWDVVCCRAGGATQHPPCGCGVMTDNLELCGVLQPSPRRSMSGCISCTPARKPLPTTRPGSGS